MRVSVSSGPASQPREQSVVAYLNDLSGQLEGLSENVSELENALAIVIAISPHSPESLADNRPGVSPPPPPAPSELSERLRDCVLRVQCTRARIDNLLSSLTLH